MKKRLEPTFRLACFRCGQGLFDDTIRFAVDASQRASRCKHHVLKHCANLPPPFFAGECQPIRGGVTASPGSRRDYDAPNKVPVRLVRVRG